MIFLTLCCFYYIQFSTATGSGLFNIFGFQRFCFCRCGMSRPISSAIRAGRLLGGEAVTPHQFPWLATINIGTDTIGGSLISNRHVVTAASPVYGLPANNLTVTLGSHDRCGDGSPALVNSVSSLVVHPGYSPSNGDNDIALIYLRHTVAFNEFVSPICLPFYGYLENGRYALVVSWAEHSGNSTCTPRVTNLPMLPKKSCFSIIDLLTLDKGCLGPLGTKSIVCKGDIGAPVMAQWTSSTPFRLLGVVSQASCLDSSPPLYTRISEHTGWIYSHIRSDCTCV